jgi:hypothetical protein
MILEKLLENEEFQNYLIENKIDKLNFDINLIYNHIIENINNFIFDDVNTTYENIKEYSKIQTLRYIEENILASAWNTTKSVFSTGTNMTTGIGSQVAASSTANKIVSNSAMGTASIVDTAVAGNYVGGIFSPVKTLASGANLLPTEIGATGVMTIFGSTMSAGFLGYSIGDLGNHIPIVKDKIYPFIRNDVSDGGLGMMWNVDKLVNAYNWTDDKVQQGAVSLFNFITKASAETHPAPVSSGINHFSFMSMFGKVASNVVHAAQTGDYKSVLPDVSHYRDIIPKQFVEQMQIKFYNKIPVVEKSTFDSIREFANEYPKYYVPIIVFGMCGIIFKLKRKH